MYWQCRDPVRRWDHSGPTIGHETRKTSQCQTGSAEVHFGFVFRSTFLRVKPTGKTVEALPTYVGSGQYCFWWVTLSYPQQYSQVVASSSPGRPLYRSSSFDDASQSFFLLDGGYCSDELLFYVVALRVNIGASDGMTRQFEATTTNVQYVFYIRSSSKGCCLNPKGWCIGTPYYPFSTPRKIQVRICYSYLICILCKF